MFGHDHAQTLLLLLFCIPLSASAISQLLVLITVLALTKAISMSRSTIGPAANCRWRSRPRPMVVPHGVRQYV